MTIVGYVSGEMTKQIGDMKSLVSVKTIKRYGPMNLKVPPLRWVVRRAMAS